MSLNYTVIFPGDGFVNVSSVNVFTPVWGGAASIANSSFYLCLFAVYFICFGILLRTIRNRIKQNAITHPSKGNDGVMKRNHIIMFILAGLMVAIQCINLLIRIGSDILFIRARLIVEANERVSYGHYVAIWVLAAFSTFFMFLNFVMLFIILFFVQMVFWRTAATMRAISKKTFKRIRLFTRITIVLFVIACLIVLTLASIFIPITTFGFISKSVSSTINYILLGIILLLYVKDTTAILISGILVIKTIRKSILKVKKQVTNKESKMENPFIVTFSLMIGLIGCILLQLFAVILGAVLVADRDEYKFIWHFVNCAGILIFSTLTLALFYPMFIQTDTVFQELHMDDTKSTFSNTENYSLPPTSARNSRHSVMYPMEIKKNKSISEVSSPPHDVTSTHISIVSPIDVSLIHNNTPHSSTSSNSSQEENHETKMAQQQMPEVSL